MVRVLVEGPPHVAEVERQDLPHRVARVEGRAVLQVDEAIDRVLDVLEVVGALRGLEPMLYHNELHAVSLVVALEGEAVAAEPPHSQLEVVLAIQELVEGIDWGKIVDQGVRGVGDCCDQVAVVVRAVEEDCELLLEEAAEVLEVVDVRGLDENVHEGGAIAVCLLEADREVWSSDAGGLRLEAAVHGG